MSLPRTPLGRGYALFAAFAGQVALTLAVESRVALFSGTPWVVPFVALSTCTLAAAMAWFIRAAWLGPLRSRVLAVPGLALGGLYLAMILYGPG